MKRNLELREEAGRLVTEARSILAKAEEEKRSLTTEEQTRFDALHTDAEGKISTAERLERQADIESDSKDPEPNVGNNQDVDPGKPDPDRSNPLATEEYRNAFNSYLRRGRDAMEPEQRAVLQVDKDISGGFISGSERFIKKLLKDLDNVVVIRQLATVNQVGRSESLGQPTLDSTISDFNWAGETTVAEEDDLTFGKRELKPRDLQRKIVRISKALLESQHIDTEQVVIDEVNIALGRTLEQAFMTGDGSNKPLGLFTASADGISTSRDVATDMGTTAMTADGLINVQGALKEGYQPKARWLFNRDGITQIRKFKDNNDQYVWNPGLQAGQPNTILSKPYTVGDYVPNTFTAGLYVGMYGDFSYYWIADAVSMAVQRLIEKYAEYGQIGLLFDKMACDGAPWKQEAFVRIKLAS